MKCWRDFKEGNWNKTIDVSDFIKKNYIPYTGGSEFLCGTTERTDRVFARVEELLVKETMCHHFLHSNQDT